MIFPLMSLPAFGKLLHHSNHCLERIFRGRAVFPGNAAGLAPVHQDIPAFSFLQGYRPHHAAAGLPSVARILVYMFAPEAMGAVVGKTGAVNLHPAPAAGKVLSAPLEPLFFHHTIAENHTWERVYPVPVDL